jgi:hypothetical protein
MNMTFTYWYRKNPTIHTQKSEDINRMYEKTPPNKGCINSIIGMRARKCSGAPALPTQPLTGIKM